MIVHPVITNRLRSQKKEKMSSYIPKSTKEKETLIYLSLIAALGKSTGRTREELDAYSQSYLQSQYGDDPFASSIPEHYKEAFGPDALSAEKWQVVGLLYVSNQYKETEGYLYRMIPRVLKYLGQETTEEIYYSAVKNVRRLPRAHMARL